LRALVWLERWGREWMAQTAPGLIRKLAAALPELLAG